MPATHNRQKKVRLFQGPPDTKYPYGTKKQPIEQYYYSDREWDRLGCGPLPEQRKRKNFKEAHARGNPKIDGKVVKGYN